MEQREIKFRAFQDNEILTSPISSNYGLNRFFGMLYEDTLIMQYTGLKDKNGKEIYEGDIIFDNSINAKAQVVFGQFETLKDDWGFSDKSPKFCILWRDKSGYSELRDTIEVIGNIYENPNLLI